MLLLLTACTSSDADSSPAPAEDTATELDTGSDGDSADTADTGSSPLLEFAAGDLHLVIPAYIPPSDAGWAEIVSAAIESQGVLIINPSNGPGTSTNTELAEALLLARGQGARVLGYVPTGYGLREGADADEDALKYDTWYAVDGLLYDEVATDCAAASSWYGARATAARAQLGEALLMMRAPATPCGEYLDAVDAILVADDTWQQVQNFTPPSWMSGVNPARVGLLTSEAGPSHLGTALQLARDNGVGWVYVTDDRPPEPWDVVPRYLSDEVAAVVADGP